MVEPDLQEREAQDATTLHGIEDFSRGNPYIGGWLLHQRAQPVTKLEFWIVDQEGRKSSVREWPEKKDPFTKEDLLNSEDNQVQQLIFQIRISTYIPNNERLANRLIALFNDAKEEDPDSTGISVDSIRSFCNFFQKHTYLKYPIITLTPDNNIYASWEGEENRLFSVHFLPDGITNFVIFKPNDRHPERTIRLSGIATSDILMETVAPHGVNDWISE